MIIKVPLFSELCKMGRKTANKKMKPRTGGVGVDSLEAELSDLFKTLPPIKRAELTKVEL
jgi:hypothetical protein